MPESVVVVKLWPKTTPGRGNYIDADLGIAAIPLWVFARQGDGSGDSKHRVVDEGTQTGLCVHRVVVGHRLKGRDVDPVVVRCHFQIASAVAVGDCTDVEVSASIRLFAVADGYALADADNRAVAQPGKGRFHFSGVVGQYRSAIQRQVVEAEVVQHVGIIVARNVPGQVGPFGFGDRSIPKGATRQSIR